MNDKFRSGMIAPHSKCRIHRINPCTNYSGAPKFADQISFHEGMNDTKWEELEKACKKEKDQKVRTRMVAVRMVRVLNMSADETAGILVHCPTWVRDRLRCYDEGDLEGFRDLAVGRVAVTALL